MIVQSSVTISFSATVGHCTGNCERLCGQIVICVRVNVAFLCRFYEWQTTKPGSKQPFFIYFADNKPRTAGAQQLSRPAVEGSVKDDSGAVPPNEGRMLTLAGLFDIWTPPPEVHTEEYRPTYVTVTFVMDLWLPVMTIAKGY